MNLRRTLVTATIIIGFLASIFVGQHTRATTSTRFATAPYASRPYTSHRTPISTTWYCAGVPAFDETVGGEIVVANPTDVELNGHITYMNSDGAPPVVQALVAPPRDKLTLDVKAVMTGAIVSAMVEIEGGEGMVEQRAIFPAGDAVASCVTQTSPTWYLADGWTMGGSSEQLIITNPYEDTVNVDITFYTKSGPRTPGAFQGDSIDPQSVKVITVSDSGLQEESIIGVKVVASRGRLIVSRAQHYEGGGRLGYTLDLGVPAPTEQLWFADGDHGTDIVEQYVLFNPTEEDAEATVTVLGIPQTDGFIAPEAIPVPAGDVVNFDTADITGLPDGPHSMVFSTVDGKNSLVVERVLTRPTDGGPVTTVVASMTPEYAFAPRWYLPIGVDEADDQGLVVYNPYQSSATISLKAVGPGGEVAVPGMDAIELPGAGIVTIPLTDPSVFGKILVVEASAGVFVERRLPRGHDLAGLSGSWALPECGPCKFSSPPSS
jgi:Family of unknown function (DUF5719)